MGKNKGRIALLIQKGPGDKGLTNQAWYVGEDVPTLMQCNAARKPCMAFFLGFPERRDYGRGPLPKGLY